MDQQSFAGQQACLTQQTDLMCQRGTCGAPAWLIPVIAFFLAIAAGVLFFFGLIPSAFIVLIAMGVFALFAIILVIVLIARGFGSCCLRRFVPWVIVSAFILLTLVIFTLGVIFVPGSILLAILFGVITFFYFMTVLGILLLVLCQLRFL